jgi:ribosome-associated protein
MRKKTEKKSVKKISSLTNKKTAILQFKKIVLDVLENSKLEDLVILDVSKSTPWYSYLIIASANSKRQVFAAMGHVISKAKECGVKIIGHEGKMEDDWALVDLGDIIVHIMLPETRSFYALEKLWGEDLSSKRKTKRSKKN